MSDSTTLQELEEAKAPLLDYLANAGCLRPVRSVRDKDLLIHDIVMFQVVHRVKGPFVRYLSGLCLVVPVFYFISSKILLCVSVLLVIYCMSCVVHVPLLMSCVYL